MLKLFSLALTLAFTESTQRVPVPVQGNAPNSMGNFLKKATPPESSLLKSPPEPHDEEHHIVETGTKSAEEIRGQWSKPGRVNRISGLLNGGKTGLLGSRPALPIKLEISGRTTATFTGLKAVNTELKKIGSFVSEFTYARRMKKSIRNILLASERNVLDQQNMSILLEAYPLGLEEMSEQYELFTGCAFDIHFDEYNVITGEPNMAPYPKVFSVTKDQEAGTGFEPGLRKVNGKKYARLHSNVAPMWDEEKGKGVHVSVSEMTTIFAGGPYITYFSMDDGKGGVGRLTLGKVKAGGTGWRLSYPGIIPHGGLATWDVTSGYVTSTQHVFGPKAWYMSYDVAGIDIPENVWVDFSGDLPRSRTPSEMEAYVRNGDIDNDGIMDVHRLVDVFDNQTLSLVTDE